MRAANSLTHLTEWRVLIVFEAMHASCAPLASGTRALAVPIQGIRNPQILGIIQTFPTNKRFKIT
jgi:hypothetical protein